jgi:hypothetical protein
VTRASTALSEGAWSRRLASALWEDPCSLVRNRESRRRVGRSGEELPER